MLFVLVTSAQKASTQPELGPDEFKAAIDSPGVQLIDVRTPNEYAAGHIPGSINIDWTAPDYETTFVKLDADRPVLLYCAMGGRSEQALEYLTSKGYKVQHLEGGFNAWKEGGGAVEK